LFFIIHIKVINKVVSSVIYCFVCCLVAGWSSGVGSLCEDGSQRHRVRGHAVDMWGVPSHETSAQYVQLWDGKCEWRVCSTCPYNNSIINIIDMDFCVGRQWMYSLCFSFLLIKAGCKFSLCSSFCSTLSLSFTGPFFLLRV